MTNRFFNISAFFFFYFAIIGVYVIFLPKILQTINYTTVEIGIIFSISPLMRFITPFFFLKHFSLTKRVLHFSLIAMLVSIILFYLTIDDFYLFALANVIYGISSGLVLPYIETYSLVVLKKERYGRSRLYGSIGFMLVGLILAKYLDDYSMGLHFFTVTITFSVLFAYLIAKDGKHFTNRKEKENRDGFNFLSNSNLWVTMFLMQVSFGAFYSFFTIYETQHGISLETVSYLWAFGVICEIILFYYQAIVLKFDLYKIIKFTVFMTVVRWMILYLYPESLTMSFISQSFHALSFALYHTATLSFLYTIYKNKKLAAQFYYGIGFGLGGFTGSLIAGYFYGEYLYLSSAIIAFIAFLSLQLGRKDEKFMGRKNSAAL